MKSSKKLLVALLVFTMLLSTVSVGFAAEAKTEAAAVTRAKALGILKGDQAGNLNLDKPITRAEALTLIVRISGLEGSADLMKGMTQFADVTAAHWASGYVNLGVGQKIVNGYPDGSFKPEGQVTYAEMVKMLLYAMNYGVTVEGAAWPAGVMGKADQLDLFDKVNAAPNVPALRGDVVQMIDNSLTVKHLVQTGYGDLKQYEEGKDTFLSKLKVDELKDVRVTEIAKANSKLDDDEIRLEGKDVDDYYILKADISPEEIFGLEVDAWAKDDEVFFVKAKTADKDVIVASVTKVLKDNNSKVTGFKVDGKEYDLAKNAVVYRNFKEDVQNVAIDDFGRVVLERGEVAFASLFNFKSVGVATKVDGKEIEFVDETAAKDDLDMTDAKKIYVYNSKLGAADLKDVEENSYIAYWEASDKYHIVVNNETETGTVDKIRTDGIVVDGETYDKAEDAVATVDEGKTFKAWSAIADIKDLVEEKVTLVFNLDGDVFLVNSASEASSDKLYGIVTYYTGGRSPEYTIFNKDGKEVDYKAAKRDSVDNNGIVVDHESYLAKGVENIKFAAIEYKLDADNEISEGDVLAELKTTGAATIEKVADRKYVQINDTTQKRYINKDTVIITAFSDDDPADAKLDPELVSYDKFISSSIAAGTKAYVYADNLDAKLIVLLNPELNLLGSDVYYGVALEDAVRVKGGYEAEIHVFGEGKKVYKVDKTLTEGSVIAFKLDGDEVKFVSGSPVTTFDTYTVRDDDISVAGAAYEKVDSGAVMYSLDEDGAIDVKLNVNRLKNLSADHVIAYVVDENGLVVAAVVKKP